MYEELIARLRYKAEVFSEFSQESEVFNEFSQAELYREAADAIEELTEKNKRLYDDLGLAKAAVEDAYVAGRTWALRPLSNLDDHQHYSGRFIKSIMGAEDGKN